MDRIFGQYSSGNRSGIEESYSDRYDDQINASDDLDTGIPDLESEKSAA